MKQALTAGGSISVWFESAKIALEKMGIVFEEDFELPGLKGNHPEYGDIVIEFFIPAEGKTRMEIAVQDPAVIAAFKENVVPAFRYVSELISQQPEEETVEGEAEEAVPETDREAEAVDDEPEAEAQETESVDEELEAEAQEPESVVESLETEAQEPESTDDEPEVNVEKTVSDAEAEVTDAEVPDAAKNDDLDDQADMNPETADAEETNEATMVAADVSDAPQAIDSIKAEPQVQYCKHCRSEMKAGENRCPVCGKKQKGKGGLIALIIVLVLLVIGGAAGFAAYKYTGGEFSVARIKSLILGDGSSVNEVYVSGEKGSVQLVTVNQYAEVQIGMTYDKVCSILGGEGTFLEPEVQLTYANGDVVVLKTYYWAAKGTDGANVCVTFRNGLVETISQSGMQNE